MIESGSGPEQAIGGRSSGGLVSRRWLACLLTILVVVPAWAGVKSSGPLAERAARDDGRTRGVATAPLTLIEYSDFSCGYCLKFFRETWPQIRMKYVETGKVRFVYRDFPRAAQGPGVETALAARCAGDQGHYWPMHDRLFASEGRLGPAEYQRHAQVLGLDRGQFATCLEKARHTEAIFQDRRDGVAFGIRGTPGFVLLRTAGATQGTVEELSIIVIPGAFPFEVFEEQIDRLLAEAGRNDKG